MRRFQFRLQSLLDVKRQWEEQAQQDVLQQEMGLAGLRSQRESLHQAVLAQQARLIFARHAPVEMEEVRQDRRMLEHLERAVADKDRQIEQCRQELERLKEILVERKRDRETVEKLRERDYAGWRREAARLDQCALDEVSSIAFNRRRQAGEARTWVLFTIMMVLVAFLIYVTGTRSGRAWMDRFNQNIIDLHLFMGEGKPGLSGEVTAATGEPVLVEASAGAGASLESVRRERERLSRWEEQLRQKEKQVALELEALAGIRDEIAAKRSEVDQQVQQLQQLLEQKRSEESRQREEMLDKLAKLYAGSKAKDAAQLLMERDLDTTVEIVRRMRERDVVKILEEMSKLQGEPGGPSGSERASALMDLYVEKAIQKPGS